MNPTRQPFALASQVSHSCPTCSLACYCGDDIDDCLFSNDEDVSQCIHCDDDSMDLDENDDEI